MDKYSAVEKILLKQGKFHISLELDRINKIMDLLGNPQNNIKIIHVAGTNGKGSTCAIINQILIENGFKTGLFTSPHLVKYNERIKINNRSISDEKFYELVTNIDTFAKDNKLSLTEFEILTAVMYKYFYDEAVDYAVIEVGLGGRFDATNIIKKPILSVITSISKDHTERLGNTVEKIAFEKAGIIKNDIPVIVNKENKGMSVIYKVAKQKKSEIIYPKRAAIKYENNRNLMKYGNKVYELSLLGKNQVQNASLALCVADVLGLKDKKKMNCALKKVKWNARFEYIKDKNILLDGCHNPDGASVLRKNLNFYFPNEKRIFVYTSLKNKDFISVQKKLFRAGDKIYHYRINDKKFISVSDIIYDAESIDITELMELLNNEEREELLIICGSLYALGDILGKIKLCS